MKNFNFKMRCFSGFILLSLIASCSKEVQSESDLPVGNSEEFIKPISEEDYFTAKTVDKSESIEFFKNLPTEFSKEENTIGLEVDVETLRFEELTNTNAELLVLDANSKFEDLDTQAWQLEVNGEIETVLIHKNNSGTDVDGLYSGVVLYTDLSGKIWNIDIVEQGKITGEVDLDKLKQSSNRYPDPKPCWGIACGITLQEVVVFDDAPRYTPYTDNIGTGVIPFQRFFGPGGPNPNNQYRGFNWEGMLFARYPGEAQKFIRMMEELAPDVSVKDMKEFLDCYDKTKSATITVYADQPVKNSSIPVAGLDSADPDVGHSFVTISQNGHTSTFGFYPNTDGIKSLAVAPSVIGNNASTDYDVSVTKTIDGPTFALVLNQAINYGSKYHVGAYNCTNYARDLGNLAGMDIPSAWGMYPSTIGMGGQNPGKLGEVIRGMKGQAGVTVNDAGGTSPSSANECQ